jgi:hypothetical protein
MVVPHTNHQDEPRAHPFVRFLGKLVLDVLNLIAQTFELVLDLGELLQTYDRSQILHHHHQLEEFFETMLHLHLYQSEQR